MKQTLLGALATLVAGAVAAAAFLWSGFIDVAADTPHTPAVYRLLELARERSIVRRIDGIEVPADLADAGRQRRGAGNYDAMCAGCHLIPYPGTCGRRPLRVSYSLWEKVARRAG